MENRREAGGGMGMMEKKNCDYGHESNSNNNNKNNPELTERDCEKPR